MAAQKAKVKPGPRKTHAAFNPSVDALQKALDPEDLSNHHSEANVADHGGTKKDKPLSRPTFLSETIGEAETRKRP